MAILCSARQDASTDMLLTLGVECWVGGVETPSGFSRIAKNGRAQHRRFLRTLSAILSTPFIKIVSPCHLRSGHQVRSSDLTSQKVVMLQ